MGYEIDQFSRKSLIVDPVTGNPVEINDSGQMHVVLRGAICSCNTTDTPLLANGTFTGTGAEMLDYGSIYVNIFSDQDSAILGLQLEQSSDNVNWDHCDSYSYFANTGKVYSLNPAAKYYRIIYINGTTDQTQFRLQTILKKTMSLASSHRIGDPIVDDDDAQLMMAVIKGKTPAGPYVSGEFTNSGNFKTSLEELENAVSVNGNTQLRITGYNSSGFEYDTDSATSSQTAISYPHHKVHTGDTYCMELNGALSTDQALQFLITTPAFITDPVTDSTPEFHFVWEYYLSGKGNFTIDRSVTAISGGTAAVPLNHNGNSSKVSSSTTTLTGVVGTPIAYTTNVIIVNEHFGVGKNTGASVTRGNERVLESGSAHLIALTAEANTLEGWVRITWYEKIPDSL